MNVCGFVLLIVKQQVFERVKRFSKAFDNFMGEETVPGGVVLVV